MFEPEGQGLAEEGPLVKTQKKVKNWLWIPGCCGCLY